MSRRLFVSLLVLSVNSVVLSTRAAEPHSPTAPTKSLTALANQLSGHWQGSLEYRDYQTDKRVRIPVRRVSEVLEDGVTRLHRSFYDDGPKGTVLITAVESYDASGGHQVATFRAKHTMAASHGVARIAQEAGADHWTIVIETTGRDNDRPARIRETLTLAGTTLTVLKEVSHDPSASPHAPFDFRNRTLLTRVADTTATPAILQK